MYLPRTGTPNTRNGMTYCHESQICTKCCRVPALPGTHRSGKDGGFTAEFGIRDTIYITVKFQHRNPLQEIRTREAAATQPKPTNQTSRQRVDTKAVNRTESDRGTHRRESAAASGACRAPCRSAASPPWTGRRGPLPTPQPPPPERAGTRAPAPRNRTRAPRRGGPGRERDPRRAPKGAGCRTPETARPAESAAEAAGSGSGNESGASGERDASTARPTRRREGGGEAGGGRGEERRGGGGSPVSVAPLVSPARPAPRSGRGGIKKRPGKSRDFFLSCVGTFLRRR